MTLDVRLLMQSAYPQDPGGDAERVHAHLIGRVDIEPCEAVARAAGPVQGGAFVGVAAHRSRPGGDPPP